MANEEHLRRCECVYVCLCDFDHESILLRSGCAVARARRPKAGQKSLGRSPCFPTWICRLRQAFGKIFGTLPAVF